MQKTNQIPTAFVRKIAVTVSTAAIFLYNTVSAQTLQYPTQFEVGIGSMLEAPTLILEDAFHTIDDDLSSIILYPLENPETTSLFLFGVGALILADVPLTSYYQDSVEPIFGNFRLPTLNLGSSFDVFSNESRYLIAGIAGSYALGVISNDERSQATAVLATKAITYSYLTSHILLKSGIGRNRPVQNLSTFDGDPGVFTSDPFDFGNFHGIAIDSDWYGTAMPSFHVTQYFAVARVYSGMYDNYWIPYGLAGVLFASNVKGHRHWVSDMFAGAVIGTMIGEIVLREYDTGKAGNFSIIPYASTDGFGINFSKDF